MKAKSRQPKRLIEPEDLVGEEWAEWYRLTPAERWLETEKLWQQYLAMGGSLDPEPDTQSPFFNPKTSRARPAHGRASVRVLRRQSLTAMQTWPFSQKAEAQNHLFRLKYQMAPRVAQSVSPMAIG